MQLGSHKLWHFWVIGFQKGKNKRKRKNNLRHSRLMFSLMVPFNFKKIYNICTLGSKCQNYVFLLLYNKSFVVVVVRE